MYSHTCKAHAKFSKEQNQWFAVLDNGEQYLIGDGTSQDLDCKRDEGKQILIYIEAWETKLIRLLN